MNITTRNLNRVIRGETSSISFKYIEELCKYLECTVDELIDAIKAKTQGMPFRRLPLPKDISKRINFQ